jgi:hypothetical protein
LEERGVCGGGGNGIGVVKVIITYERYSGFFLESLQSYLQHISHVRIEAGVGALKCPEDLRLSRQFSVWYFGT